MKRKIIVIGTSAGGLEALKQVLLKFKYFDKVAMIIVQHLNPKGKSYLAQIFGEMIDHAVYEIEDKTVIKQGAVFIVPPNYHALIEKNGVFTLTTTEKVNYARPSIDVTFGSFADAFGEIVIGIILTGANQDGGEGLKQIKEAGGYAIVQEPSTAEFREMPEYAIKSANPDEIISIDEIGNRLNQIIVESGEKSC